MWGMAEESCQSLISSLLFKENVYKLVQSVNISSAPRGCCPLDPPTGHCPCAPHSTTTKTFDPIPMSEHGQAEPYKCFQSQCHGTSQQVKIPLGKGREATAGRSSLQSQRSSFSSFDFGNNGTFIHDYALCDLDWKSRSI